MNNVPAEPAVLTQQMLALNQLTVSDFLSNPERSFFIWTDAQLIADSTRTVKRAMWGKFVRWMKGENLNLISITSGHLEDFLKEEEIQKAQRSRYLRMISRVYVFLQDLGLPGSANPASDAIKESIGKGSNDATVFLDQEEKGRVEQIILKRLRENGRAAQKIEKEGKGRKKQTWIKARDAVIAATMIGAGASVSSILSLTVNCTNCDTDSEALEKISFAKEGGGHYQAIVLPIASTALTAWRRLRIAKSSIGIQMFPADINSRGGKDVPSPSMHPATVFRAVKSIFTEAGITGRRACGQTLRNTYAATLIELGYSDEDLTAYMGFTFIESAIRLRHQYIGDTNEEAAHPERRRTAAKKQNDLAKITTMNT